MISQSGAVIFLCGNRDYDGRISNSKGVLQEYEITKELGRFPIPIGCTEYAAEVIWNDVMKNINSFYPMKGVKRYFNTLGNRMKSDRDLINALLAIAHKAINWEN